MTTVSVGVDLMTTVEDGKTVEDGVTCEVAVGVASTPRADRGVLFVEHPTNKAAGINAIASKLPLSFFISTLPELLC